jgi:predicted nucleic acid-binding Zn ribbon protein
VSQPRREPRGIGAAIGLLTRELEPQTLLAAVQRAWPEAVGEAVAAVASPTGTRKGTVVVTCESAVWAQELTLMAPDLVARLNARIDGEPVAGLRCQATAAASWARAC